jgi:tRNA(Ile)-lysidine synthase
MVLARVRRTVREREMLAPGQRVLVACSGGPDSVALVLVLHRLASELSIATAVASVDHGVREGSAADVDVARSVAAELELPFHALSLDLDRGASLQARARDARYAALRELADRERFDRIAVGHTMDDQAETVLSRILRGAGVRGLAAIEPSRADGVIRPLIDCRRADVHAFVAQSGLSIARDPSNADPRYERVRLRERIVPLLLEEDPALIEHLAELAQDARLLAELVDGLAEPIADLDRLRAMPRALRQASLAKWAEGVASQPPGRAQIQGLEGLLRGHGEVLLADGWVASIAGGSLCAEKLATPKKKGRLPRVPKASDH